MSNLVIQYVEQQVKEKRKPRQTTSRYQKGCQLCTQGKVFAVREGSRYFVQSQKEMDLLYNVEVTEDGDWTCTCPDFLNANLCKHCYSCIMYEISRGGQ